MNININWNYGNEYNNSTLIKTDGTIKGSDYSNIAFDIPNNIQFSITQNPNVDPARFSYYTRSQVNQLTNIIKSISDDIIFSTSNAPDLYEMSVNIYESNK